MPPTPSERLAGLGLSLPPPPRAVGQYSPVVRSGNLAYVSGQIVTEQGAVVSPGAVGAEVSPEAARALAGRAALQALSAVAAAVGSLDRIRRIVRVAVFVAVAPGFHREHEVANGATDRLVELFGDAGRPARTTVGVAGLPLGAPVELELLAEVEGS